VILHPRQTWKSKRAYDAQAERLVAMYQDNFAVFTDGCSEAVVAAGPWLGAQDRSNGLETAVASAGAKRQDEATV
jgi:hypothetical protein